MSQTDLYLVKLDFTTNTVGSGSLTLSLALDPNTPNMSGRANGTLLDGTQNPKTFAAPVTGVCHATGMGKITKVCSVQGTALISGKPPQLVLQAAPFSAEFSVDNDWTGIGTFRISEHVYDARVSLAKNLALAT